MLLIRGIYRCTNKLLYANLTIRHNIEAMHLQSLFVHTAISIYTLYTQLQVLCRSKFVVWLVCA